MVVVVLVVVVLNVVAIPVFTAVVSHTHMHLFCTRSVSRLARPESEISQKSRPLAKQIAYCTKELQFHIVTLHQRTII